MFVARFASFPRMIKSVLLEAGVTCSRPVGPAEDITHSDQQRIDSFHKFVRPMSDIQPSGHLGYGLARVLLKKTYEMGARAHHMPRRFETFLRWHQRVDASTSNLKGDNDMIEVRYRLMDVSDIESVVSLIAKAMNSNEGEWAKKTIQFHFFCKTHNIDDGRHYLLALVDNAIVGITGLHTYSWGPADITWLGWFAVSPEFQGKKIGYQLMSKTIADARNKGFKRLLVETYSDDDFETARKFYERYGFEIVGNIKDYIRRGVDMVVFGMSL